MTNQGEAVALETDNVFFPLKSIQGNEKSILMNEVTETNTVEQKSYDSNLDSRFARLKKSLRKRSVSIL